MFLKSLTMRGFKSFADKTTVALEPGISVIVGPNGSGKSNVVDAISWVLGEQGPRSLRGGRMEDVIFAGSPQRPALAMAEVTLTIDNSARDLPLDFSEVTITRSLFRSGEAEYRLNGLPCRLLDVREVLSDGGIGREQHTIISQGHLDDMLTADPIQIRAYIEEAAGVAKHRRRKERALRRIAAAEANLVRITDLLTEVRRHLRPLREQAEVARRHAGLLEESERLGVILTARELVEIRGRLGTGAGGTGAQVSETTAELAALEQAIAGAGRARVDAAARTESARELSWSLNRLTERLRSTARLARERERTLAAELAGITEAGAQARLDEVARELAVTQPDLLAAAAAHEAAEAALALRRQELVVAEAALGDAQARVAPLRRAQREAESELQRLRGELVTARAGLASSEREASRVGLRRESIEAARVRAVALLEEANAALDALEATEAPQMEALAELEDHLEALLGQRASALGALGDAEREAATWRARAQVRAGASPQAVRKLANSGIEGVIGVFSDLVEVPETSKAALEALVGPPQSVLVVADPAAAQRVLEAAGGGEPLGILVASAPSAVPLEGQRLIDLVRPLAAESAAALEGVYVAAGTSEAARLAGEHPEGVFVTLAGVMATGRVLVRTSAAAGARAAQAEATLATQRQRLSELDAAIAASRATSQEAASVLNRADASIAAAVDRAASAERELHGLDRETSVLQDAQQRSAVAAQVLADKVSTLTQVLSAAETRAEQAQRELLSHSDEQSSASRARAAAAAALDDARLLTGKAAERRRLLTERIASLQRAGAAAEAQASAVGGRRAELTARMLRAGAIATSAGVLGRGAATWSAQADEAHRARAATAAEAESAAAGLANSRRGLTQRLEVLREQARAEDHSRSELQIRLRIVEERLAEGGRDTQGIIERFGVRLEDENPALLADPWDRSAAADSETLRRRLTRLERDLAAMGRVNPLAAAEFDSLTEREQFLNTQIADVRSSRRDLRQVVTSVDEEIQSQFDAAFGDVSREYEQVFSTLFPGGTGRLRLSDPSDPLETGVEVEARPGGKNVRRVSLLSGGERALAGLALAFSIFRARPSPFYVLDEVEAALDDMNLHRFLGLLSDFRDSSQLIVVTHQKRTMELADVLYGVSIRSTGATQIISERLGRPAPGPGVGPGHPATQPLRLPVALDR